MKYFSMFSGIGGFELGINQAFQRQATVQPERQVDVLRPTGDKPDSNSLMGDGWGSCPVCVGYSEIDKYAIKVYERRFSGHTNYGNADIINEKELPDFDLLVGGFPCQSFSIAGKRQGFNDTRGTQFFNIARILAEKRPRHLVLENVKGLLSHDSGKTFQTILGVLADLGYRVEWQVLNSKDFGVPQNRERIYIVGHLGERCGGQVFPITGDNSENNRKHFNAAGINNPSRGYEIRKDGLASSLRATEMGSKNFIANRQSVQIKRFKPNTEHSTRGSQSTINIRRLTPKECERLQGFPDDWTTGESDTQRYKMCGNAVTVNVVEAVMRRLYV